MISYYQQVADLPPVEQPDPRVKLLEFLSREVAPARRRRHKTQQVAAYELGVTDRTWRNWEHGMAVPHGTDLLRLFSYLDLRLDEGLVKELSTKGLYPIPSVLVSA